MSSAAGHQRDKQEFTFIKYEDVKDLKYRKEAREHIARKRVIQGDLERERRDHADWNSWSRRRAIADAIASTAKPSPSSPAASSQSPEPSHSTEVAPPVSSEPAASSSSCSCRSVGASGAFCANCGSNSIIYLSPSPQTAVSTFARDQFNAHPLELSQDDELLRLYWKSSMNKVLYFADLPPSSKLVSPILSFYHAALQSRTTFLGLVLLPAATARAKVFATQDDMYRRGALALGSYNGLVDYFHESGGQLTVNDIIGIYAVSCAFLDKREEPVSAYEAVMRSNATVKMSHTKSGQAVNIVPVLEWMRIVLPSLVSTSKRMGAPVFRLHFGRLFLLLSNTYQLAQEQASLGAFTRNSTRVTVFQKGTSLYKILTTPVKGFTGRQPYPTFYKVVLSRILVYIHANMLRLRYCDAEEQNRYFTALVSTADACCAALNGVDAMGMFFWCTLSVPELLDYEISCIMEKISIPIKKWFANDWYDMTDELTAWLIQEPDENGNIDLPTLDLEALRRDVWIEMGWDPEDND